MSGDKFLDLDAALAEHAEAQTPVTLRLFGEKWELPGVLPAMVMVRIARWAAEGRDLNTDLTPIELVAIASDLVPMQALDQWSQRGLGVDKFDVVIPMILDLYKAQIEQAIGGAEGEAVAPKQGASASGRSSNGGRSSKRTSPASTRSRSRTT